MLISNVIKLKKSIMDKRRLYIALIIISILYRNYTEYQSNAINK